MMCVRWRQFTRGVHENVNQEMSATYLCIQMPDVSVTIHPVVFCAARVIMKLGAHENGSRERESETWVKTVDKRTG